MSNIYIIVLMTKHYYIFIIIIKFIISFIVKIISKYIS